MLVHRMTSAECRIVLTRARHGRLACARFDQPYVVPVSIFFDIEEDAVYGFSTVGQKVRWMRDNPLVCIEVEEIVSRADWRTVVAFGSYEEILRRGPGAELRERAMQMFGRQRDWWLPGAANVEASEPRSATVVYRIRLTRMSGRRTGPAIDEGRPAAPRGF